MNRVLEHLGTQYPIIQSPMGFIARSQLASAVSNAGGLGIIETSSGEIEQCMEEIRKMHQLTDRPFGVNLAIMFLRSFPLPESMMKVTWLNRLHDRSEGVPYGAALGPAPLMVFTDTPWMSFATATQVASL